MISSPRGPDAPLIETRALTKSYGRVHALDSLDLVVEPGCILGFLGPNGAGKTTTIRLLLGLLRPSSGQARIGGRDCWRKGKQIRQELAYVPGDLRLYPTWTARAALKLVGHIRRRDLLGPGLELAETLALDPDLRVRAMSLGTRQKLGLVLALAARPRLLVLDEPTSGLDPIVQERLREHLLGFAREGGTVFFSSHTLSEVESLCERVVILRAGRCVVDTTIEELRRRATRRIRLTWSADPPPVDHPLPGGLSLIESQEREWTLGLDRPVPEVLPWLRELDLEDLSISPPDLESLFHDYYR